MMIHAQPGDERLSRRIRLLWPRREALDERRGGHPEIPLIHEAQREDVRGYPPQLEIAHRRGMQPAIVQNGRIERFGQQLSQ